MDPRHAWCSRPPLPPYAAAPPAPANPYPPPPPPNPYPAAPPAPVNPYPVAPPAPANPYTVAPPFQSPFYYQTTPPPPPQPQQPPPLPPPPPHDPYDPFTDPHHPLPMMNPPPPQQWNSIPHPPEYLNPNYDNYAHAGVKRMRVEEFGEGHGLGQGQGQTRVSNLDRNVNSNGSFSVSNDDDRRLKLIREHGGSGVSDSRNGLELSSCSSFNKGNLSDFRLSNVDKREIVYDHDLSYNSSKRYHMVNDRDYVIGDGNNSSSGRMGTSGRVNGGYYDSINRFGLERSELDDSCRMQHGMEVKSGHYGSPYTNEQSGINRLHNQSSQMSLGRPFSASPSPPLPPPCAVEPFRSRLPESMVSTSPSGRAYFPISAGSDASKVATYPPLTEANPFSSTYLPHKGIQTIHHELPKTYQRESELFPSQYTTSDVQKIVDASVLLKHPHRTTRPDHIVIILRGLPGSGKSYLAKMLRDLEVENGGKAPRIHTMDDYFMMEVEKIEESEGSKSSSSVRGRKQATKIVMEYCYEPEMEEAYRSSMLKAFKKTLDEGVYSFVIVDDRNLRVADFVQFWATAKRSGYEVYMLEAAYKDPVGCAARNIHGFTQDDIRKMADQWEEAPSMYMQLDIRSLLHGDKLLDNEIQEVDMDTGEGDPTCVPSCSDESNAGMVGAHSTSNGPHRDDKKHDATGPPYQKEDESKKLGNSKWSNDLDEDDAPSTYARERNLNTLPGLNQSYRKKGKSVHWGDKVANIGFSIGAAKMAYVSSLVIGPGAGYNLNTNPLTEADTTALRQNTGKMQNILREQLRAEHESFKAVFDKRRQRIGGLDLDEE